MRAALITLFALGCGAAQARDTATLGEAVQSYNDGVRWERYSIAANLIPPRERSQFVDDMDQRSHDVKITEYDVVRVDPRGEHAAKVQIKMSWYKTAEGTVHETSAIQSWERHGKVWWMVEETRLRGAEMPGLAESPIESPTAARSR